MCAGWTPVEIEPRGIVWKPEGDNWSLASALAAQSTLELLEYQRVRSCGEASCVHSAMAQLQARFYTENQK